MPSQLQLVDPIGFLVGDLALSAGLPLALKTTKVRKQDIAAFAWRSPSSQNVYGVNPTATSQYRTASFAQTYGVTEPCRLPAY
jgi:tRNA(Leu) C34 or U34 (ribose-2'-O)-methylase TrmL